MILLPDGVCGLQMDNKMDEKDCYEHTHWEPFQAGALYGFITGGLLVFFICFVLWH